MKMKTKRCVKCSEEKNIKEFSLRSEKDKRGKYYYKSYCKKCCVIQATDWVEKNKEKVREYQKNYQKKNYKLRT